MKRIGDFLFFIFLSLSECCRYFSVRPAVNFFTRYTNFEKKFAEFSLEGIDEIYCMSVNDAFVMNAWAKDQKLEYVKVIPDGSGRFTRGMGMLVRKDPDDLGYRY